MFLAMPVQVNVTSDFMKLTVPFIPEKRYMRFLEKRSRYIDALYFPLPSGPVLDARIRQAQPSVKKLGKLLSTFPAQDKYVLLNTTLIPPSFYHDATFLDSTVKDIEILFTLGNLTGIVFNDAYLLSALSAKKRPFFSNIEAVPSVNLMLNSPIRVFALLDFIQETPFRMPGKIVPDRNLNRRPGELKDLYDAVKIRHPDVRVELLANEGCLFHCPFKPAHDAHMAIAHAGLVKNTTHRINQEFGCQAVLSRTPELFLKSPFIRPEDQQVYKKSADSIKLCGRTLGGDFLASCIDAYISKSWDGNLLELMDASRWMADLYHINNKKLDPGFFNMITGCKADCKTCRKCADLFSRASEKKSLTIKSYKDLA